MSGPGDHDGDESKIDLLMPESIKSVLDNYNYLLVFSLVTIPIALVIVIYFDILAPSIAVSVAVILIYSVQTATIFKQNDIINRQREIDRVNHIPVLQIHRIRPYEGQYGAELNDYFEVELSNFGKGVATGLKGVTTLKSVGSQDNKNQIPYDVNEYTVELVRKRAKESDWKPIKGSRISPGERHVRYIFETSIDMDTDSGSNPDKEDDVDYISQALKTLAEADVDRVRLQLYLKYEDQLGNNGTEHIFDYVIATGEQQTLSEAMETAVAYDEYKGRPDRFDMPQLR